MLYSELMSKAKQLVIYIDDVTLKSYLDPDYRYVLYLANLTSDNVSDFQGITDDIIAEALRLEVVARNIKVDKFPIVMDWVNQIISTTIQPVTIDQENQLFKNIMQYMQLNDTLKDKERALEHKEQQLEQKSNIKQIVPGMNFTRAKP